MSKARILIVDDEQDIRNLLKISLERMGYSTATAGTFEEAQRCIEQKNFQLALTDMRLPDGTGFQVIKAFKNHLPQVPIAVMTAYDTTDIAVEAMKSGAFDFIPKPIRHQRLQTLVNDALGQSVEHPASHQSDSEQLITGATETINQLRSMISRVSQTQAPVLILGESGTGKELTARSIHQQSHRREKPFVAVNCGAIPGELMESEFFGHMKGSFTGATSNKIGLFQAAEDGTLFLDEIADLPLHMQVKLLRAVQEKAIRPVGSYEESDVNVRILSATHKDLLTEVQAGRFRQDLYYRLNVIELQVPSLRERLDDIPQICTEILAHLGAIRSQLSDEAITKLKSYSFPGNVRELENILHRAFALSDGDLLSAENIKLPNLCGSTPIESNIEKSADDWPGIASALEIRDLEAHLASLEKQIIEQVLEAEKWNRGNAAKRLGLTQRQFRYKLQKYAFSDEESID